MTIQFVGGYFDGDRTPESDKFPEIVERTTPNSDTRFRYRLFSCEGLGLRYILVRQWRPSAQECRGK